MVGRERDQPRFIGDMPHTWVGSDFVRSVLDMFAYDEEDALVLAAGVLPEWLQSEVGVGVSGLHTPWGVISYRMTQRGNQVRVTFDTPTPAPPKGFVLRPLDAAIRSARADGRAITTNGNEVRFAAMPRELVLTY